MRATRWIIVFLLVMGAAFATAEGKRIAVLFGVSAYKDPGSPNLKTFPNLQFAHLDAHRLGARLQQLGWDVIERVSEPGGKDEASKVSLGLTLQTLSTGPEDTLLFFYSGNGCEAAGSGYLACSDSVLQATQDGSPGRPIAGSMLSLGEVGQFLAKQAAKKRILLLDISRKERTMVMERGSGTAMMRADLVAEYARLSKGGPASWCLLSSCDRGEESYEAEELMAGKGGGVFTCALLDALASPMSVDSGGRIRPDLMWETVKLQVATWCLSSGRTMTPRWQADMIEPILIGRKS